MGVSVRVFMLVFVQDSQHASMYVCMICVHVAVFVCEELLFEKMSWLLCSFFAISSLLSFSEALAMGPLYCLSPRPQHNVSSKEIHWKQHMVLTIMI